MLESVPPALTFKVPPPVKANAPLVPPFVTVKLFPMVAILPAATLTKEVVEAKEPPTLKVWAVLACSI